MKDRCHIEFRPAYTEMTMTLPPLPVATNLAALLEASALLHHHLCPRQVLGVRMGLLAGHVFGLDLPQPDKRLLAIVETDGCLTSGISVSTNCWIHHRTLRVEDYGKTAATFVDTLTGQAVRLAPRASARHEALALAPEARSHWEGMLLGYQRLPDEALLTVEDVRLAVPVEKLVSHAGYRVSCAICGEEIMNEREVVRDGLSLCRACAGGGYYHPLEAELSSPITSAQRTMLLQRPIRGRQTTA
jgi:formylmethanofuran dehydrogenase subunit E